MKYRDVSGEQEGNPRIAGIRNKEYANAAATGRVEAAVERRLGRMAHFGEPERSFSCYLQEIISDEPSFAAESLGFWRHKRKKTANNSEKQR